MDFWTDEAFAEISFLKNLLSPLRMDQGTRGPPHELGLRQFSSPSEKMLAAVLLVPLGLSPLTMSRHEYFISEMATATTPPALGAAGRHLARWREGVRDAERLLHAAPERERGGDRLRVRQGRLRYEMPRVSPPQREGVAEGRELGRLVAGREPHDERGGDARELAAAASARERG